MTNLIKYIFFGSFWGEAFFVRELVKPRRINSFSYYKRQVYLLSMNYVDNAENLV